VEFSAGTGLTHAGVVLRMCSVFSLWLHYQNENVRGVVGTSGALGRMCSHMYQAGDV
jgi:hypothetical protein